MKVLVTGGTGFVGRHVVEELRRQGHKVVLLARDPDSPRTAGFARNHLAELRRGDVTDAATLTASCVSVDAVIHFVGIISEARRQTFENVHTTGTRNIVNAAQRAGVRRFIHMSALGTRSDARARYHRSKWAAEEIVRNSGLDWTIFRPSIIYGAGDGFVNLFASIIRWSPAVPLIGGGQMRFQPIPVSAVAKAFVGALSEPASIGKTLDLCGPERLTLEQVIDAIVEIKRCRRWKLALPFALAKLQAALMEVLFGFFLGKPPPLSRDQIIMLGEDNVGDGSTAAELFNLEMPQFREGISRYL